MLRVTPFVGVWIETVVMTSTWRSLTVTPFVGVWIETRLSSRNMPPWACHTLRGCVDWNLLYLNLLTILHSHTLRGCVDWNIDGMCASAGMYVTPFVGVWIETTNVCGICRMSTSHTLRGCVDWNYPSLQLLLTRPVSHSSWVCGLKLVLYAKRRLTKQSHPSWVCGLKQNNCQGVYQ